jgi:hypothetical protein
VKSRGGGVSLVVGEDLRFSQIVSLEGWDIVGKLCGRRMSMGYLNSWIEAKWISLIVYASIFHLLSGGWIKFIFWSQEDVRVFLVGHWYWDCHILCAKPWHPLFDAKEEALSTIPI